MPDYDRQNLVCVATVLVVQCALLWFASRASGIAFGLAALLFAYTGLTVYALMHEAIHENLHSDSRVNYLAGCLVSLLFPVSFTFMQIPHEVHHRNNRTNNEMFDYYYPDDNRLVKYAQWYSILIGIYPPIIPLGSILMAVVPGLFRLSPWRRARSSSIIFDQDLFTPAVVRRIRLEVLAGVAFWVLVVQWLSISWTALLVLYAAFWFNWSTRQYVTHAFSPRDVRDGAWNLSVSPLMERVLLNGHWDLVHHQYPGLRWQELPAQGQHSQAPIPYWRQYLRLWGGPRPNTEVAPTALANVD